MTPLLLRQDSGPLRGRMDWVLIGSAGLLIMQGTLAILSAAAPLPGYGQILQKHFLAIGIGALLFLFGLGFNYQIYQDQWRTIYVCTMLMMVGVLFVGFTARGQKAWIRLPFINFQPSELARILTVLVLANFLDRRGGKAQDVGTVLGAFALTAPIMALILKQPDFSSTLTFFPILIVMLFCAGANLGQLLGMAGYGVITLALPLLWTLVGLHPEWKAYSLIAFFLRLSEFHWPFFLVLGGVFIGAYLLWKFFLMARVPLPGLYFGAAALILAGGLCSAVLVNHQIKGYQRNRFVAFLVPEMDPRGAGYNVRQAQIAIGSGGLWGKGVFSGTQSQLGFLPERHTDFVYAVIGEEMGFIGSLGVLTLYMVLLWRIVNAARLSRDRYGSLVCAGLVSYYGFSLLVNVGMCLGLVPVAGIPLPLLSYGGSNLAMTLLALGIVANIYSRRYALL